MKRYNPQILGRDIDDAIAFMDEHMVGEYVKYDDVNELIYAASRVIRAIQITDRKDGVGDRSILEEQTIDKLRKVLEDGENE